MVVGIIIENWLWVKPWVFETFDFPRALLDQNLLRFASVWWKYSQRAKDSKYVSKCFQQKKTVNLPWSKMIQTTMWLCAIQSGCFICFTVESKKANHVNCNLSYPLKGLNSFIIS